MAQNGSPRKYRRQNALDRFIRERRSHENRGSNKHTNQHNHSNGNRTDLRNRQGKNNRSRGPNDNHHHYDNHANQHNSRNHNRQNARHDKSHSNRNLSRSRSEAAAQLARDHIASDTFQNERPVQINFTYPTTRTFTGYQASNFSVPQWHSTAMDWDTTQPNDLLMNDVSGSYMMLTDRKTALQKGFMTQNNYDRSYRIDESRLDRFSKQRQQARLKISEARKKLTETLAARRTWNPILTSYGREAVKVKVSWRHARIPEPAKKFQEPINYRSMGDGFQFTFRYPVFAHQVNPSFAIATIPVSSSTALLPIHPVFSRLQNSYSKRGPNTICVNNEWITAAELIERKRNHDALIARFKALDARRLQYRATKTQRELTKTAEDALKAAIYHSRLNFNVGGSNSSQNKRNPYPWSQPSDFQRVYAALQREIDVQHELFDTKSRLFLFNHHHQLQNLQSRSTNPYREHELRTQEYQAHMLKIQSQKVALMKHLNRQSLYRAAVPADDLFHVLSNDASPVTTRFPALLL